MVKIEGDEMKIKRVLSIVLFAVLFTGLASIDFLDEANAETSHNLSNPRTKTIKNEYNLDDLETTWDCVWFGNYPQSDSTGRDKEPIKWRVLSVNGDDLFLISDMNLDHQPYNNTDNNNIDKTVTWEECTLRSWLNNDFYNAAFNSSEKGAVKTTIVVNKAFNSGHDDYNNTSDKVFLLAHDESVDNKYGFKQTYKGSKTRQAKDSDYVKDKRTNEVPDVANGAWMVRTPRYDPIIGKYQRVEYISSTGLFDSSIGDGILSRPMAVRPVLHINAASTQWHYAGTVCSDGTVDENDGSSDGMWTQDDEWCKKNYSAVPIRLTEEDYDKLTGGKSPVTKHLYDKLISTAGKDGQCFGLASTAILAKRKAVKVNELTQGAKTLNAANAYDERVQSTIGTYFLGQFSSKFLKHKLDFDSNDIESKFEIIENADFPFLLAYAGHAVVATGIERAPQGDPWIENGHQYDSRIVTYDSNDYNEMWSASIGSWGYLYYNSKTYDWEVPYWKEGYNTEVSSYNGDEITAACDDIDVLKSIDVRSSDWKTWVAIYNPLSGTTVSKGGREYFLTEENYTQDGIISFYTLGRLCGSTEKQALNIMFEDTEPFAITPTNNEGVDMSILYPDSFVSAKADSYLLLNSPKPGTVNLTGISGKYELSLTSDDQHMIYHTVLIEGRDSDIYANLTDQGVKISGDNLGSVKFTAIGEEETVKGTLSTDESVVLITTVNPDLHVYTDKDHDGYLYDEITPELEITCNHKWDKTYTIDKEPTLTTEGLESIHCSRCGAIKEGSTRTVAKLKRTSITKATITKVVNKTYTGKNLTQAPVVKIGNKTLKAGTDYKLSYKNNKKIGRATVTITGLGGYTESVNKTFLIKPKGTTLTKVTATKKGFTAKWKKQNKQTTGYQIQYSTNKKFKSDNKTATVTKNKTVSKKIKKLKAKKKYYVRIRTYKTVSGKKYYSGWSKAKVVTTKK